MEETGSEAAVTPRAIARTVGIAAPSIYAHFPDRESILLAVVQEAFAEPGQAMTTAMTAAMTTAMTEDPVTNLRRACAASSSAVGGPVSPMFPCPDDTLNRIIGRQPY